MSKNPLTEKQPLALQATAEYGELDHTTVSKWHARILMSLHFVLSTRKEAYAAPYANLQTIQHLVERFFGKRYDTPNLQYWVEDLMKRDYVVLYDANEIVEKNFFSLTEYGVELFVSLYQVREVLFESNSRNSIAFLN